MAQSFYIVLVRHAHAAPASTGMEDAARPLSETGAREAAAAGERLRAALEEIGAGARTVLSSPKRRAIETARILARGIGDGEVAEHGPLASVQDPAALLASLPAPAHRFEDGPATIVLIGHEPDLGRTLAYLLDPAWRGSIPFRTAGFAIVETGAVPTHRPGRLRRFGEPEDAPAARG